MDYEIRTPANEQEWDAYFDLRYRILREPLGQPRGSERNDGDETGIHFALFSGKRIVAIARLDHYEEQCAQVRFVAVEAELQGRGYGKLIMESTETKALQSGYTEMVLHARDYVVDFYKSIGYEWVAPSHNLFGILQHFKMTKKLS
jgi:predicted GNAT family N-acyltransferase